MQNSAYDAISTQIGLDRSSKVNLLVALSIKVLCIRCSNEKSVLKFRTREGQRETLTHQFTGANFQFNFHTCCFIVFWFCCLVSGHHSNNLYWKSKVYATKTTDPCISEKNYRNASVLHLIAWAMQNQMPSFQLMNEKLWLWGIQKM